MGLFNFVEQYYGVGFLTNFINQKAAFFITYVSRRCSVKQCYGMFFLEFRHVETD